MKTRLIAVLGVMALFCTTFVQAATVNLSSLASPTATPTPSPFCAAGLVDLTTAPNNMVFSGTLHAAQGDTVEAVLYSSFSSNSGTVNGVQPSGWGALTNGANVQININATGFYTFVVTTVGCPANSVSLSVP